MAEKRNIYCTHQDCNSTQSHTVCDNKATCEKCGRKKQIKKSQTESPKTTPYKPPTRLENRLNKISAIITEEGAPKFKPEGDKQKTQKGAHNPNKPTEYTMLKFNREFKHKDDHNTLKS